MTTIYINADDFGLGTSVNKAIVECFNSGIINSTTLMANMPGFDEAIELLRLDELAALKHIRIRGLMGIATNTDKEKQIKDEYYELKTFFDGVKQSFFRKDDNFDTLSMGMSADYKMAIEEGSNMVRLGSTIFGQRVIKHWKNN